MRIDLVFPKFKLLSGAERLILSLGRALADRGHRVRVVCHRFHPSCRPLAEALRVVETGVELDRTGNHYLDSMLSYALAGRLRSAIAPDADVVCLFGPALALAAGRRRGAARLLYFCYEPPRAAGIDRTDVVERIGAWGRLVGPALGLYRIVDGWLVRRVDAILVNGEFGRERVREEYGLESRVITHGVTLGPTGEGREGSRRRLGLDPRAPVAITVNFLHPRKRVALLLEAWQEVERRRPEARLLVVGDGPEAERLRATTARLGLRNVELRGFVPESELPRYYEAADLLVHVAREETFGLTILEAGSFGLPVVVADEGGPRYTVADGETGLRIRAGAGEIAGALVALLGDPERARAMGERARERVRERFRWEQGADDFLAACAAAGAPS